MRTARRVRAALGLLGALALGGCGGASYVHSDAALGRVVVYKNGVAYFERTAELERGSLHLSVPSHLVDDLLKSFRILDADTGEPAPAGLPTIASDGADGRVDVELAFTGPLPRRVKLSYLTEAPTWKPSYRVAVRPGGKVDFEGWAIVDNTSGEDWRDVRLGVASSSALSFRYDLRSVRPVMRDTLLSSDRFAMAPPVGESTYGGAGDGSSVLWEITADTAGVIGALSGDPAAEARRLAEGLGGLRGRVGELLGQARKEKDVVRTLCLSDKLTQLEVAARTAAEHGASLAEAVAHHDGGQTAHLVAVLGVLGSRGESLAAEAMQCVGSEQGYAGDTVVTATIDPGLPPDDEDGSSFGRGPVATPRPPDPSSTPAAAAPSELDALATRLRGELGNRRIRIEGHPLDGDAEPRAAALARAEAVKRKLVERGVASGRIEAVGRATAGRPGAAVRIVEVPDAASPSAPRVADAAADAADAEPIGTSHFELEGTLSVASGHAAMLPILHAETEGDIVYYYDAETARGDDVFPFRALRLVNPSDAALESGPVAVFGAEGFIGEGLCEPIPAHSVAFVPFARDRQVVVERRPSERDAIARLASFEGGVFSAELRHARVTTFTLHNRSGERAVVYLHHTPAAGYGMADAPAAAERLGAAYLYRVEVEPRGRAELALEEATSVLSTVDLRAAAGATLLRAYVAESGSAAAQGPDAVFRTELGRLLAEATSLGELEQKATGRRHALGRERRRAAELREQLAFLGTQPKAQPTAAPAGKGPERGAGQGLGARLGALDAELARLTTELVELQQEVLERRVRLEDDLAALRLEPAAPALGLR